MVEIFNNIVTFFIELFNAVLLFVQDLLIDVLIFMLFVLTKIVELVPVPEFLATPIDTYIPEEIVWLLIQSGFPQALSLLIGGITFKILKQLLTLGIWK